jgi:cytochrome c biogenesis protein CcdA
VTQSLRYLAGKYPERIGVSVHTIKEPSAQVLLQALCTRHAVPEKLHLVTPAVFYGDRALVGEESFRERNLVAEIVGYLGEAHAATPEPTEAELAQAAETIRDRFERIAWPAVLAAGLLDGVNPCAFVTVIFLLSYLSLLKYRRRDAMLVGAAFTAAVFATYLLIGLGFLAFAGYLQEQPHFRDVVRWLAVALAAVVGVLNLRDAWRIWRGSLADMDLKLGDGLRRRINEVIRHHVRLRHFVLGAMAIGVAVSVLELACTGQVYLPTILFMLSSGGAEGRAMALLAGYNVAFIAPLVAVFVLYGYGITDQALSRWLARHGAWIKLGTGALFLGLAGLILA